MTPDTSENKIQQNSINLLQNLGYKFISREENLKLRGGKSSEVLFREILIQKLGEINSYEYKGKRYKFSQSSILKAVDELAGVSLNEGLMIANEKITNLLLLGTSIEENL